MVDPTGQRRPVRSPDGKGRRGGHPTGRISREQWLEAALDMLADGGVDAVRVDRLAKALKVSRSGFYWHFADRNALLEEMMAYWAGTFTEDLAGEAEKRSRDPAKKLWLVADLIRNVQATRFDLAFWSWAQHDEAVAALVEKVRDFRAEYIGSLFAAMGFEGEELEARTRLYVVYNSWSSTMFSGDEPESQRVLDLILSGAPDDGGR